MCCRAETSSMKIKIFLVLVVLGVDGEQSFLKQPRSVEVIEWVGGYHKLRL